MPVFPDIPPVDALLRTNENPLSNGGLWTALPWATASGEIHEGEGWSPLNAYPTVEGAYVTGREISNPICYLQIQTLPGSPGRMFGLWSCMTTAQSGYRLNCAQPGSGVFNITIEKWVTGTPTELLSVHSVAVTSGDFIWFAVTGGLLSAWHERSGEWQLLGSVTDSTYSKGLVGIEAKGNNGRYENFGAAPWGGPQAASIPASLRDAFPLQLTIGAEDCTFLLSEDFTFSNADPGGYEIASFPIPKDMPQVLRGMKVTLSCGTQVAWEGRVKELQRSLGQKTLIQCVGWTTVLKNELVREIFIDRNMSKWEGPSLATQIGLISGGSNPQGPALAINPSGEPALVLAATGAWATGGVPAINATYDAQGIPIRAVFFRVEKGENVNPSDGAWFWDATLSTLVGGTINTGNLRESGTLEEYFYTSGEARVFAGFHMFYSVAAGTQGVIYATYWSKVAVYGASSATMISRGTNPVGFYTSDIVRWLLGTLDILSIGVIPEATGFVVEQSAYLTPVPAETIISDMAKLVSCHWGSWEGLTYFCGNGSGTATPRLDFRPYPQTPTAFAWRQECEVCDIREDLTNQYNRAAVTYTEAAGKESTVEVEIENPVLTRAGLQQTIALNMGDGSQASAEAYGKLALEMLQIQAPVTGQVTIKEPIHRMSGGPMAPWMLKAGVDRLRIPDLPCSDVWGEHNELPIGRVECSMGEDGLTTTIEIGRGRNLMEALTSQLEEATGIATNG